MRLQKLLRPLQQGWLTELQQLQLQQMLPPNSFSPLGDEQDSLHTLCNLSQDTTWPSLLLMHTCVAHTDHHALFPLFSSFPNTTVKGFGELETTSVYNEAVHFEKQNGSLTKPAFWVCV